MAGKSDGSKAQAEAKERPAQSGTEKKREVFIRDGIYPDPEAAFRVRGANIGAIKDKCIFVLDTNALLAPYGVGNKTLGEVARVFKSLVEQKRLRVPAQVAREFADNRAKRLTDIYDEVQKKRQRPVLARSPLLDSMSSYAAVAKAEKAVDEAWSIYAAALDEMLKQMKAWNWDDPVSTLYAEVFVGTGVVTSIKFDPEALRADLGRRNEYNIPPGYKDKNKDDEGIGDLLIWKTILDVGKAEGKDVVFVSGDAKADWWHRAAGAALYPRFELLAEFDAASGGRSFNIATLADFLELFGVDENAIEEVRQEERRPKLAPIEESPTYKDDVERAVAEWIWQTWQGVHRVDVTHQFPLLEVSQAGDTVTGVEILASDVPHATGARLTGALLNRLADATERWILGSYRRRKVVLVWVFRDEHTANHAEVPAVGGGGRAGWSRELQVVAGWMNRGAFVERSTGPTPASAPTGVDRIVE
jgi:hypothetical protein